MTPRTLPSARPKGEAPRRSARIVLLLGALLGLALLRPGPLLQDAAAGAAYRVAVLEFDNASAGRELDALGKGLQSMLTTDLGQVPQVELIERARLGDVQAELKLGKSGALDPKTAARLGKLAGATHLLAGSYTVIGERMRLDARLFAVEGGQVLLAEKGEGEKDAFFELEKTLVSKLVDALGVKLRPKERAEMARVHTADFEAFRRFSQGVQLFDEKRYQEAVVAMRDATGRDKDFKLAALTLAGYEQLIDKMRGQTDATRAAEEELKRLGQQRKGSAEAQVVEKLWEYARRKGKEAQLDRLAAMYELAMVYGDIGNTSDRPRALPELRKTEDRFAMKRTGDALCQAYYAEAVRLFPQVPPIVSESVTFARGLPSDPGKAAWLVGETRRNLLELGKVKGHGSDLRTTYLRAVLGDPEGSDSDGLGFMGRMQLDMRQAADFRQRLFDMGLELPGPPEAAREYRREGLRKIARAQRVVLALDRSTAALTRLAGEGDSQLMASATREIELNRDLAKLLAAPAPPELREFLQLKLAAQQSYPENALREGQKLFAAPALTPVAAHALAELRRFPRGDQYLLLGATPAWAIFGGDHLLSGPRDEPLRAGEVRYHRGPPRNVSAGQEPGDTVLVLGGQPGRDLDLKMEISFAAPADFWPPEVRPRRESTAADGAPAPGRPQVGVLYGLRDVDAGEEEDPRTGQKTLRALRGGLLIVREGGVAAADIVETERKRSWNRSPWRVLAETVKEERRADVRGATIPVSVRVSGGVVQATVGATSLRYNTGSEGGFAGLLFRGVGYAAVRKLSVGIRP